MYNGIIVAGIIVGVLSLVALIVYLAIYRRRTDIDENSREFLQKKKREYFITSLIMIVCFVVVLALILVFALRFGWTTTALCMVPSLAVSLFLAIRNYVLSIRMHHKIIHLNNKSN